VGPEEVAVVEAHSWILEGLAEAAVAGEEEKP